jgi:hypothetical protein
MSDKRPLLGSQIPDLSPATVMLVPRYSYVSSRPTFACEKLLSLWTARWRSNQPVAVMVCPHKSELFSKNTFALPRTTWFLWNLDRPKYPKFQPVLSSLFSIHKLGAHHPFTPMSHIVGCMLYNYIAASLKFHPPCTGLVLCTLFCWLNCP